jgi:hypothetical protein
MAYSFKTIPGRPTFGVFNKPQDAGEYILNKKAKTSFCGGNVCKPSKTVKTQGNLLLLKQSNYLNYYQCVNNVNTTNLNINLITKLNLTDVNVLQPVDMSLNATPYTYYTIDPSGELFGNTPCGYNNYLNFLQYNPPSTVSPDPPIIYNNI